MTTIAATLCYLPIAPNVSDIHVSYRDDGSFGMIEVFAESERVDKPNNILAEVAKRLIDGEQSTHAVTSKTTVIIRNFPIRHGKNYSGDPKKRSTQFSFKFNKDVFDFETAKHRDRIFDLTIGEGEYLEVKNKKLVRHPTKLNARIHSVDGGSNYSGWYQINIDANYSVSTFRERERGYSLPLAAELFFSVNATAMPGKPSISFSLDQVDVSNSRAKLSSSSTEGSTIQLNRRK